MNVEFRNFDGPSDWGYVQKHMPIKRVEDTCGLVAVNTDNNTTVAMAVFDTWTWNSVQVHQIVTDPMVLDHGFFEGVADCVYNVADREVMIALVPSDNAQALLMNEKIGFEQVANIKDAVNTGIDLLVLQMRKEQCKFWKAPEMKEVAKNGVS